MRLYNTLSRKKEEFVPLNSNLVSIYVCGITPYDTTHLGHAFVYVSFDALIRYLKFKNYKVNYTQNVTDIDDDILRKAKEENKDWKETGQFWTDRFLKDLKFLNVLPPTHYVKATNSIKEIIEIINNLVNKKLAYEKNGNVYYEVKKFKKYGELSKYAKQQMILISKERGADPNDPLKKDPLDFILWQKSKQGEPFWKSPWGKGRPGWHIECSAMVNEYLGARIDIHGGGRDLIFPHHESEIAQSESYTGKKPFVKYWMHISMVLYEGEKMSKSLGNLIMVSELSKKYSANSIRWLLLAHHYRQPWEFDYSEIEEAQDKILMIEKMLDKKSDGEPNISLWRELESLLDDDFDTPKALDLIFKTAEGLNAGTGKHEAQNFVKKGLEILGFNL
ncbi:MAG: cysteine--tRNA ligase [Patescibacteria group bacterium]|nr:cysteine--tRNA ligase [Patescibacteria group bacterium]